MASRSIQLDAVSKKSILTPVMILEDQKLSTREPHDITLPIAAMSKHTYPPYCYLISYSPNGEQMISGFDRTGIQRWDLQAGKKIEEARYIFEQEVHDAMGISKDGLWVATVNRFTNCLKVCEMETGIVRTFDDGLGICYGTMDISADNKWLAVELSYDDVQIWSLDTGKLVFKIPCQARVRFSEDSKKLAVISQEANLLEVWDIKTQNLDVKVGGGGICEGCPPPLWTTKDKTIVATFNFNGAIDDTIDDPLEGPKTIYEFDALTLKTVGAPFEGHTIPVSIIALSFDSAILASACFDTIKLWAFKSRQLLASFDVTNPIHLVFSPNARQLAYTTFLDTKIYICDTPSDILATIQSAQQAQSDKSAAKNPRLLDINSNATRHAARRNPIQPPIVPCPQRDFATIYPQEHAFLRYLRKMLPSRMTPVRTDQPRDPLDFPATLPLPHSSSPSGQATSQAHSDMDPHENAQHISAPQSSATAPITFKTRLHHLSTWWPTRAGHALPPIVNVPLAPGKLRYATAGAPTFDDDLIRDEDYVPPAPLSSHSNSQQPPTGVRTTTGQHGGGRFCGCF